ncbi:homeobox-leucine zipper protein HAT3-like [Prosopis cineraria]|uniref:homeobox-leucine zipper protein HAT3-like n=1 Tax=Prosopis cineraria TaxID=364024 RepID=UPI00240F7970|nr:homeobox-leucine zipper protein HAT3-like [Prosopis cineraria]
MGEKDDGSGLGLSLSLGLGMNQSPSLKESLMQKPSRNLPNQRTSWNDIFFQLPDRSCEARTLPRGVDINLAPPSTVVVDCDDENGVSSPNSTVSSISGKRSERESIGGEHEAERASCSRGSDDDDGGAGGRDVDGDGDGDTSRKKLRLSKEQSIVLEETFKEHNTLNPKQKQELAKQLNLRPRQVEVWFQNRRARTKLKQTEVDCEYLRRCCETLTEENRRLQKEVQELRALKLSPQFYMHMNPPTTLTMCPSCERVAVSSTSSASSVAAAGTPPAIAPSNSAPSSSSIQRPVPLLPWVANSNRNRPVDSLNPRP